MNLQQAGQALRARTVSSVELMRHSLQRITQVDSKLKAFITVMAESAEAQAREADARFAAGTDLGPLQGIPVAVKDVFCTAGVRTTCGSKLFADYVPEQDSAVVERLRSAGAVLLGKTNMHELAYGVTSSNPHYGAVRNPWDCDRVAGGSSGGSGSAVAAGMAFMAMGSDTGGSIRIPAAFCGTVGLKPTYGRVSRIGVLPLDFSLDHMGPLTRSVRDAGATLNALAGYDPRDETSSRRPTENYVPSEKVSVRDLRIGLPENFYFDQVAPVIVDSIHHAATVLERSGARILPIRLPDVAALNTVGRIILLCEAAATMQRYLGRREDFGSDVLALLDQGSLIPGTDYVNAQRMRRVLRQQFAAIYESVDCLLTPTTPTTAPKVGQALIKIGDQEQDVRIASTRLVRGINVLGWPALSVPCGFDEQRLPIGVQIIGRPFAEALILKVGAVLEDSLGIVGQEPRL